MVDELIIYVEKVEYKLHIVMYNKYLFKLDGSNYSVILHPSRTASEASQNDFKN